MESLTDESVDTFYSCLLCQSFAPSHVCVITPERLGLCGAYNWLDGKAAFEIDPTGPNQPLVKGECLDPVRGQWANINDYVFANSKQTLSRFNAYSLLEDPMTSCGCFEAIVALMPEANGVMIVNREYLGETPAGMKFSTMANTAGGGQQVPGFIGVGKAYITSRKFISAEGGHRRIVWMPKDLKEFLREDLDKAGEAFGIESFTDMIADELVGTDTASVQAYMQKVKHPALAMWEITTPSEEAAAVDAARAGLIQAAATGSGSAVTVPAETAVAVAEPLVGPQPAAKSDVAASAAQAKPPVAKPAAAPPLPPNDGVGAMIALLERLRDAPPATELRPGMTPQEQMAALQASTAMHLLHAGVNMLLMQTAPLASVAAAAVPPAVECLHCLPTEEELEAQIASSIPKPADTKPKPAEVAPRPPKPAPPPGGAERPIASAAIVLPKSVTLAPEKANVAVRTVTLGGTGTRTSAVTIGGAEVLPFRHFEGNVGHKPVVAMEVLDSPPKSYPDLLRNAYGDLLKDPAAMARYLVEKLGAEVISVRLATTHPDNGDMSPEAAGNIVKDVLNAVGVPVIVTGCSHFEKNNALMKHIASTFAGENLLLNWVETDNYKTIAATVMAYGHSVVAQTPIDVNMCKQLNILLTSMGVSADHILIDPLTSALGYGLEYTYSVMERIRTSAFTGDPMLAMPMIVNPGFEVSKVKESRAPRKDFPLWGKEEEREALLEIAASMSYLNAGADLLVVYHPLAARTLKRKIDEMMSCGK
jgi:CO dehydrogenase/acetyl-CoA synthase delta subunit